jgi:hypothetical protein
MDGAAIGVCVDDVDLQFELSRIPEIIAIEKRNPLAARTIDPDVPRCRGPTVFRQMNDDTIVRFTIEDFSLRRPRRIVHDHDFDRCECLCPHGSQSLRDEGGTVVIGNHDRN